MFANVANKTVVYSASKSGSTRVTQTDHASGSIKFLESSSSEQKRSASRSSLYSDYLMR